MFCPNCSEPKVQADTQYCTRCGTDLAGIDEFIGHDRAGKPGLRRKGVQKGAKLIVFALTLIPVWMFISAIFPPNDTLVESSPSTTVLEQLFWIGMWILLLAGAGRIAYSLIFERAESSEESGSATRLSEAKRRALSDATDFVPAEPGMWKTTGELFEPVVNKRRSSGELR